MLEFVSPIEIFFKKKNKKSLKKCGATVFCGNLVFLKMLVVGFLVCFVFQKLHCENMW